MNKKIAIIIVHWNTPDLLQKQLDGLIASQQNLNIVVVDNASEKSIAWIKKQYQSILFIENKINRGYASACNQGAMQTIGEWLLFLNPDVAITKVQIETMVAYAEKHQLVAVSPRSSSNDYNKPMPSWMSLLVEFTPLHLFIPLRFFSSKTLTGGCLLIKKDVLISIGGWDERFFLWFEDSDLTYRLKKNGFCSGCTPILIDHRGGASFTHLDKQYKRDIFFHSMSVYAKKHFNCWGRLIMWLIKNKYSSRKILPAIGCHTSITIPNMKEMLLADFFSHNSQYLSEIDELIVVSSGLNHKTIWQWRRAYPSVRFIPIEKNNGFAATVNIGLSVSTGLWIGTINDDVVLEKNWIERCLACAQKNTGALNPVIYKKDGTVESAGISILKKGKAEPYTMVSPLIKCVNVDAANAAAVLYNKEALNKIGLFDERFGSYLEDIDMSLRLHRQGYKNTVALNAKIVHCGQSTSQTMGWKKNLLDARNWIYVIGKNWQLSDFFLHGYSILLERIRNLYGIVKAFKKHKGIL